MATKKGAGKKCVPKKGVEKMKVGEVYTCEVCGLAVAIDEACGCVETCDIICCQMPMKKKRSNK